jgi:hypothetical protein
MNSALSELDELGILRTTHVPPQLSWLSPLHVQLLISVLTCGEEGMTRRRMRKYSETETDALRQLELRDFLHWERDRFGQLAFLCLTWKGEEAAQTLLKVAHHGQVPDGPSQTQG